MDYHRKLKSILGVATPLVAAVLIGWAYLLLKSETVWGNLLLTIGSSIAATWVVLMLERFIVGDRFAEMDGKIELLRDAAKTGLTRVVSAQTQFFSTTEIIDYVKGSTAVRVSGIALGFLRENTGLLAAIDNVAKSGGTVEFVVAHPDSKIVEYRDLEEQWHGQLKGRVRSSIADLFALRKKHPGHVKLFVFNGEFHNTIIVTDRCIIVRPYVFGNKGWDVPVLVFSKDNPDVVKAFAGQIDEMQQYGGQQPDSLMEVESPADLNKLMM